MPRSLASTLSNMSEKTNDVVDPPHAQSSGARPRRRSARRVISDRFYIITLMYGEDQPVTRLVDVDCNNRKMIWYDPEEPDTAFPARDLWGQPVLAPNRKTYRRLRIQPPARPELMQAFCETDWTAEMKVLNANPRRRVQ